MRPPAPGGRVRARGLPGRWLALGALVASLVVPAVLFATLVVAPAVSSAAGASPPALDVGFFDGAFTAPDGARWLSRAKAAGADVVRLDVGWVAPDTPRAPKGFRPEDPADPNYDFKAADAAVRAASADGLKVILDFTGAPRWAEGAGMPHKAFPGSWEPSAAAVGAYAVALARRYSGRFPDPANPRRRLPRVWAFQLWNEPNLPEYLAPQWVDGRAEAPIFYRRMLNAFYAGIKSVDPGALVVTAGTAPFGDPGTHGRIPPALFWRDVLCVRELGARLEGARCSDPAHFDVLAHHPYSVGPPTARALNPDDVSIPDIGKLTRILRVAEQTGGALPHIHHPIWVTEVGYNTKPPNPGGVPTATAARWLEQALELLWSQGVSLVTWYKLVDDPPYPSYGTTSQSGIYYVDGGLKPPLAQAFAFPLVATRSAPGELSVWGRSPASGRVVIERLAGGAWKPLASRFVARGGTFVVDVPGAGPATLRAEVAGHLSLPWTQP